MDVNPDEVLRTVLDRSREEGYVGYNKHDGLTSPLLRRLFGWCRWGRLGAIQLVMRCPLHIRPFLGVRKVVNPKGLSLFLRAWLRIPGEEAAAEASRLVDRLLELARGGDFPGRGWGYHYPWQDVGFFVPAETPNRVVTSFVVQSLLDACERLGRTDLDGAVRDGVRFLLEAPVTLHETDAERCVSYVPLPEIRWRVMDVPALSGAAVARAGRVLGETGWFPEATRLLAFVVNRRTPEGAWFYTDPPSDSSITHDNYHTGFILDAILDHAEATGDERFLPAYREGLAFYRKHLFESDGAPRWMHDRPYPRDVHGAAQGIVTFARAVRRGEETGGLERRILDWTLANLWQPERGWFAYRKGRLLTVRIPLLRWCQGWMAWALATYR